MPRPTMYWTFSPPPGLTPHKQIPHKFQQKTVERLQEAAAEVANNTISDIRNLWEDWYPQGWGTIPRTLRADIAADRTGIQVRFAAAGRHLKLITTLGGGIFEPGTGFNIVPGTGEYLSFYWKRFRRWARMVEVNHPGWDEDFLAEEFNIWGQRFQEEMRKAHTRGTMEVIQAAGAPKRIGSKTRKTPVNM